MSVLDATDEQFETFIKQVGIPVKSGDEGQRWSFDNRCRAINFARKYGLHLPFVDMSGIKNNSADEHSDEHPLEPVAASAAAGRDYPDLDGEEE